METIILAGGKSSRMGRNKALLELGNKRIIDFIVDEFSSISNQVLLVTNQPEEFKELNAKILVDACEFKGQGPLAGIYTGMNQCNDQHCLVIACDMPLAKRKLGLWLVEQLIVDDADAVLPFYQDKVHPLFGAYHSRIMNRIKHNLSAGKRRISDLLNELKVKVVEQKDLPVTLQSEWSTCLLNMNTLEDYEIALEIYKKS